MTLANRWPQVGDAAVELYRAKRAGEADRASAPVTVRDITATLVITSDGEKYNRDRLFPVTEGRYSARVLLSTGDAQVLIAQGRALLRSVAQSTDNLAALDRRTPEDCVGALAAIITAAHNARAELLKLMADASRLEQESDR